MIVWINGPFGGGKTTLSERLEARLPDAMVFDPEYIGYALGRLVPPSPTGDFQDLRIWRSMTLHALRRVRLEYGRTVIVPMTLVHPDYLDEIIGDLVEAGEDVLHVFLDVDADILRSRITAQVLNDDAARDQEARQWRLARVEPGLAARDSMPAGTIVLDSGRLSPDQLADEVMTLISTRTHSLAATPR